MSMDDISKEKNNKESISKKNIDKDEIMYILGDVDDKFVDEAAPRLDVHNKASKQAWARLLGFAAMFMLVVGIGIVVWKSKGTYVEDKNEVSSEAETQTENSKWPYKILDGHGGGMPEMGIEPNWDIQTISERFSYFDFSSTRYYSRVTNIDGEKLDGELGKVVLEGIDNDNMLHTINATVYKIKNVDSNCVTAIQFEDTTDYYIYMAQDYQVETLGALMDNLNLEEYMAVDTIRYNYYAYDEVFGHERPYDIEFVNLDNALILDMLLECRDVKEEIIHDDIGDFEMVAYLDIPYIGEEFLGYDYDFKHCYFDNMIYFYDSGYICINFFGQTNFKFFYIGEEKIAEFKQYVIDNCEGYEIIYKDSDWYNDYIKESSTGTDALSIVIYDAITGETYTEIIEVNTEEYTSLISQPYNPEDNN